MSEKKPGFFKRLFKFGKKAKEADDLEVVDGPTSDTALGTEEQRTPVAHAEAAANVIVDTEAGAETDAKAGIEPIEDTPGPEQHKAEQEDAAKRAAAEAEARREEAEKKRLELARQEAEQAEIRRRKDEDARKQRAAEDAARAKAAQEESDRLAAEQKAAEKEIERQKLEAERRLQEKKDIQAQELVRKEQEAAAKREQAEREEAEAKRKAEEKAAADQAEKDRIEAETAAAQKAAEEAAQDRKAKKEAERKATEEAKAAHREAERAAAEAEETPSEPDGVFEAPGETHTEFAGDTPEPLADTPEPFPVEDVPEAQPEPASGKSWFKRLKGGLSRSSSQLTESIAGVFTKKKLDDDTLQDLEDILIRADLGVETAMAITDKLASERMGKDVTDEEVREAMAGEIESVLDPVAAELELDLDHQPHVILVVGVNGSGKTTTIGKLAQKLYDAGFSTYLVAGDTFRAAAIEQLKIWGERTQSPVLSRPLGADAAGLAYDAYTEAKEQGRDVMLMDTAGRLQNKAELMDELEKIIRVLKKHDPSAPHTVLLTLDATTGQNALNQVEVFKDVSGVNGLVMTKLDGTARGGIMVAIAAKYKLPVYFIGVGEQVEDLEPFDARDFARSIAGFEA